MKTIMIFLSCIAFIFIVSAVHAVESKNVEFVGATMGAVSAVHVEGDHAYLCAGSLLAVLDISNPAKSVELGRVYLPGIASDVEVVAGYAYVADHDGGLRVIDVTDPERLHEVGFYDTPGLAEGVHVVDRYAYVADSDSLRVIDITDPKRPVEVGFYDTPGLAEGVHVVDRYAYVADGRDGGFRVIDVTDPERLHEVGFYDTPGLAEGVHVVDRYAYVADSDSLRVIDITDPKRPVEVGFYDTPGGSNGVHVVGGYAYVADGYGLRVIDITDPKRPVEVGFYDTPGRARRVHVVDSYAYVADGDYGLRVIDVTNPKSPEEVGFYDTPGESFGVHVVGRYAYVAGWGGLRVIDVTDPERPVEVGFYDTPGRARGVHVVGRYAYVADGYYGLRVIDVSDPERPEEVGFCYTSHAEGVHVVWGYAYVADGVGSLKVIDVSEPRKPKNVGYCYTPYFAHGVHVVGGYAYVAVGYYGLRVIDVSDPRKPEEVGSWYPPSYARGVHVVGGYAYVAVGEGGLRVIDVTDPRKPKEVGFCDTLSDARGVHVVGGYAYVADGDYGLRVIDVSDPKRPEEVGFYDTLGESFGVHVVGGYAYVADGSGGLCILRYTGSSFTARSLSLLAGWNLISIPLQLSDTVLGNVLQSIDGHYQSVWTYEGGWKKNIVSAPPGLNDLDTIEPGKGYWLKTTDSCTLMLLGGLITESAVPLRAGWNLVGYKGQTAKPIEEALSSITNEYISVWGYYDSGWKRHIKNAVGNNLDVMEPGRGYWINVISDCVWDVTKTTSPAPPVVWKGKGSANNVSSNIPEIPYIIYGSVEVDGVKAGSDSKLSPTVILKVDGKELASYRLGSEKRYGEHYVFEVPPWTSGKQIEVYMQFDDGEILSDSSVAVISSGTPGELIRLDLSVQRAPRTSILHQNYPNPFNPETWIPYQLKESANVEIRIYAMNGQLVRTLNLGYKPAGFYITKERSAYWDGRNEAGEPVASGAYFYTIKAGDLVATRKMILLR